MTVVGTLSITQVKNANREAISSLLHAIEGKQTFLVTSHAQPDGDALGSALAVALLLEAMGKQVTVAFVKPIPASYSWLPGASRIHTELPTKPDVAIVLECDSIERTGYSREDFKRMAPGQIVNIDHHLSGRPYADVNWIDATACAVGAMMYDVAVASGLAISADMATCLYTAVLTDTGGFMYPATTASTFALADQLVQRGADSSAIASKVYFSNTVGKIRALGEALTTMQIKRHVAWAWITESQMKRAGAVAEDCEGIVNTLIGIGEVQAAVFLRELPLAGKAMRQFKLSLRSKGKVDVAEVAASFGGGGHRTASGCTLDGPLERAIEAITAKIMAMLPA